MKPPKQTSHTNTNKALGYFTLERLGGFSEVFFGLCFFYIQGETAMQKELTITLNPNVNQNKMLESIRWKHIDIDELIQEELNIILPPIISNLTENIINLYNVKEGR